MAARQTKTEKVLDKLKSIYTIDATIFGITRIRGAIPDDIDPLLKQSNRTQTRALRYMLLEKQVELLTQEGRIKEAQDCIRAYDEEESSHRCAWNRFQSDEQHDGRIFLGAHCVAASIRDSAKVVFPDSFYQNKVGKKGYPSASHFRKYLDIQPKHIFFTRYGEYIEKPDIVKDQQQPSPQVKGFAKYDAVDPPWVLQLSLTVYSMGQFEHILRDPRVLMGIWAKAVPAGLGACRGTGKGAYVLRLEHQGQAHWFPEDEGKAKTHLAKMYGGYRELLEGKGIRAA